MLRACAAAFAVLLLLGAVPTPGSPSGAGPSRAGPSRAGLVALPCDGAEPLRPAHPIFCRLGRSYMTPRARQAMVEAARSLASRYPGTMVLYMDGSGADGKTPFWPHLSHGDGRQLDLAVLYTDRRGTPLGRTPRLNGYGAFEPPRRGDPVMCRGKLRPGDTGDPPPSRPWRLDQARTRELVAILAGDARVRRILIEPHLSKRFGMERNPKLRFAGCQAARHDDHVHVDFR